jgi:hypothetical protein
VANCVVVNRRQIIAGVSGGVMVDTAQTLAKRDDTATETLIKLRSTAPGDDASQGSITWWWDAPR